MAISFELTAEPRSDTGKGASRRLRRTGKVPAIIYGGGKDPESLTLSHNEIIRNLEHEAFYSHILTIKVGGSETQAILRDLQRHPSKPSIQHMDLQRVSASEKIHMSVPLHFVGEEVAPGVKIQGGMVSHQLNDIDITCLAANLPEYLEVDVSTLSIGDALHMSDLKLPEGVEITALVHAGDDQTVVSIVAPRSAIEEEEGVEGEEGVAPAPEVGPEEGE